MTSTTPQSVITADGDAVVTEIEIAAPPARVFQALTDERELMLWFKNPSCPVKTWKMDARSGGRYGYTTQKGSAVVNNVDEFKCHGEILEIDPPRLLVLHLVRQLASGPVAAHHRSLGTYPNRPWNSRESHAHRPRSGRSYAQGLRRRLARRSSTTEEVHRALTCGTDTPVRRLCC